MEKIRLQALVYDILLPCRKAPESDVGSVGESQGGVVRCAEPETRMSGEAGVSCRSLQRAGNIKILWMSTVPPHT